MKIPASPPPLDDCLADLSKVLTSGVFRTLAATDAKGRYLHWDELRHRRPPKDLSHEAWWATFKLARTSTRRLPLADEDGNSFTFNLPDPVLRRIHEIDSSTHGGVGMTGQLRSAEARDRYIVTSLMEEAITSSQLEGAATTRKVAKQMLRTKRKPRNTHERMIVNNYRAMEWVREHVDEPLTPDLVLELHRHLTIGTLEHDDEAGRLRRADEPIFVKSDDSGEILHEPPSAESLQSRLEDMCRFANDSGTEGDFIPPIVRAILLHFWLAYDHPFVDGNGRTARALFYWSALRAGFWLLEFITISRVIKQAPAKYGRAFLHTETDDNDTTYFIIHQLEVITRAIENLRAYIQRSLDDQRAFDSLLRTTSRFNHRQVELLRHALSHPRADYTIAEHQSYHAVVYQTARTDLLGLEGDGLLRSFKRGKTLHFVPVDGLESVLREQMNA